ncbi:hypothetical protein KM043_003802 [Ampulex compressa]|nr:hypothetical protein KM043_003802 [Ampulex compressa]
MVIEITRTSFPSAGRGPPGNQSRRRKFEEKQTGGNGRGTERSGDTPSCAYALRFSALDRNPQECAARGPGRIRRWSPPRLDILGESVSRRSPAHVGHLKEF